jgi:hypothetical protein
MTEKDPHFMEKVERILAVAYFGIHHVPGWEKRKPWGDGVTVTVSSDLSTYDFDTLTRLVVAAHDECVRLSVDHAGPRHMALRFHPRRGREGRMFDRHPTIEEAIATVRSYGPRQPAPSEGPFP